MDEQTLKDRILNSRYKLIRKLGEGGMSIVYLGEDLALSRRVAVKILKFEYLNEENLLDNFKTEARAVAKLSHENIVKVYDVGVDGDINYIIMELLENMTLKDFIKELNKRHEYMKNRDIVHIALQIALALQSAHDNGVIHKDIKPQNIIVSEGLKIKVADFGIAQFINQSTKIKLDREVGSVHYSSPEQLKCQIVDSRSDIYSFGILLYELSTGKLPFNGDVDVQVALKHLEANFISPSILNSKLNPVIEKIIHYATKREKRERFQSMNDIIQLLDILYLKPNEAFDFTLQYPELEEMYSDENEDDVKVYDIGNKKSERKFDYKTPEEEIYEECTEYEEDDSDVKISEPISAQEDFDSIDDELDGQDQIYDEKIKNNSNPNIEYIYRQREDDGDADGDLNEEGTGVFTMILKFGVVILIGIIIGALALLFIFLPKIKDAQDDQPFVLDHIEGRNFTEASDLLMKKGLMINKLKVEPSETVGENVIISQSPDEGTTVKRGQTINVIVSSGRSPIIMPNLKQKTLKEAQIRLENARLGNVSIVEEYNLLPKGMVISQKPIAEQEVYSDTLIELVVSKGPENPEISMPNLLGRTKEEATSLLKELNLDLGTITPAYSQEKEGIVIEQSVKVGERVKEGVKIDFKISMGPELDAQGNPKKPENPEEKPQETPQDTSAQNGNADAPSSNGNEQVKPNPENKPNQQTSNAQVKTFYVPLGTENPSYDIKVTVIKDGSESVIYEKTHKKEEEMVEINIKGSGVMKLRFYIDNELKKETEENFN